MKRALITAPLVAALAITAAGCGGSKASAPPATKAPTASSTADPARALRRAVQLALRQNSRLSLYTLWHNEIPAWATSSTRGPALTQLRTSAAQRRRQGIRVRHVSGKLQILSITIDPSYQRATAIVRVNDRFRPYRGGRALGRTIKQNERARVELRRIGQASRFVVWKVVLSP
jgi:hypothetical protein